MSDVLSRFDTDAFFFLNRSLQNPILDSVMPFVTDLARQPWIVAGSVFAIIWMLARGSREVRIAALMLVATIIVSDQVSSALVKALVARPRPCHALLGVHLLVGCGSGYSFPSSHAVNNFAGALVLAYFIPRATAWLFGFAATVAFSRIYVGVHYPSDVLGGAAIGLACAAGMIVLFEVVERRVVQRRAERRQIP